MADYIEVISNGSINIDDVVPIGFADVILYLVQKTLKTLGFHVKLLLKMSCNLGIELDTFNRCAINDVGHSYRCVINDVRHSMSGCEGERGNRICSWYAATT